MFLSKYIQAQQPCNTPLDSLTKTIVIGDEVTTPVPPDDPPISPPTNPPDGGYKAIFWIHGMIGSTVPNSGEVGLKSWSVVAPWVDEHYYTKSQLITYADYQYSWITAYSKLKDQIIGTWNEPHLVDGILEPPVKDQIDLPEKSFAIAHSFGSVVIRKADTEDPLDGVKGIATFTGPHGGSKLAYYVYPAYNAGYDESGSTELWDEFTSSLGKFASDIAAPPIEELYQESFIDKLSWIIGPFDTEEIIKKAANTIAKQLAPQIVKNLAPASVQVLKPDNMDNLGLNEQIVSDDEGSHRVAIAANITGDDPANNANTHNSAAKMFFSGLHSVTDAELFQAGKQNEIAVAELEKNKGRYSARYKLYKTLYEKKRSLFPLCLFGTKVVFDPNPPLEDNYGYVCIGSNYVIPDGWVDKKWKQVAKLRDMYSKGLSAFTKLNDYWEYVCGAREYNYEQSLLGSCECEDIKNETKTVTEDVYEQQCQDHFDNENHLFYECDWTPYKSSWVRLNPYDGLLTVDSQHNWNTDQDIRKVTFNDSNHLTIRNDDNTHDALTNLLDGTYGKFFRTAKK